MKLTHWQLGMITLPDGVHWGARNTATGTAGFGRAADLDRAFARMTAFVAANPTPVLVAHTVPQTVQKST